MAASRIEVGENDEDLGARTSGEVRAHAHPSTD
jgi:hypothetical protein